MPLAAGTNIQAASRRLFAPIAPTYEVGAAVLSLGQNSRWRRALVDGLGVDPPVRILDVASGTGSISRELARRGFEVVSLDSSAEMLRHAPALASPRVQGLAQRLPFSDTAFDALTFGYLLRYVEDPVACLRELARVVRPGGTLAMLEFDRPRGAWRPLWWLYTRIGLPVAGAALGPGWYDVGRFLGPSIDGFCRQLGRDGLANLWRAAGLYDVRIARMSLGGAVLAWGRRP